MFLKEIRITRVSPCYAETGKIRLKAVLSDDITGVMPYLNTVIDSAVYNPHGTNLLFNDDFRMITLYPQKLTMVKALNNTDARQVLARVHNLINDTYARREEIEPCHEPKRRPSPLQLYSWLPGTNCGSCGEKTCVAFAALVFRGLRKIESCAPLYTGAYRDQREVLLELAAALGFNMGGG